MRIDFNISQTELGKFRTSCEAAIRNVGSGTKAAATEAGIAIMNDSLRQVPVDTGTLQNSAYLGVSRREDIASYRYGAVLGYGEPEGIGAHVDLGPLEWYMVPNNGVNPRNGFQASTYAGRVHEDLDMPHSNGGKAKFLEDPVRNWASGKFARTAMTYWRQAIETVNRGAFRPIYRFSRFTGRFKFEQRRETHYKFEQHRTGTQRSGKTVYKGEER